MLGANLGLLLYGEVSVMEKKKKKKKKISDLSSFVNVTLHTSTSIVDRLEWPTDLINQIIKSN